MIEFRCPGCKRHFQLKDHFAGKKAKCNKCGGDITVPLIEPPAAPAPAAQVPVRVRRLQAESEQIQTLFANWPLLSIKSISGDPPEIYQFQYTVRGIEKLNAGQPVFRDEHVVQIQLTIDYPRLSPQCRMITPVFHPNIDAASICVGDHWTAGERLADLVIRIGEMISYQAYNIKSPLNAEAAMWADLNATKLPTDARNLHPAEIAAK